MAVVAEKVVTSGSKRQKVPRGFKSTDVGLIPEDWNLEPLGRYAIFRTGPFGSALHKSDYVYGGIPVINPMQIVANKLVPTEGMAIRESKAKTLSDFRLNTGDIIIARRGEMGRCAVVKPKYAGWLCGTGAMIIRVGASSDARYIQRVLSSPPVIAAIEKASVGTTMVNLNQLTLANLKIFLPPTKAEQEAISEAIDDADAVIESLEQLIEKKRLIKQGAIQDLLSGRRRLPGFSGEWTTRALEEISEIRSGGTPSTTNPDFWRGEIPWCTPTDITALGHGKYIVNTMKKISEIGLLKSSAELIPEQSIIMTSRATIGECAINKTPVATNQGFKNLVPRSGIDNEFLYYLMQTQKERLLALCGGSTFLEIGKRQLAKLTVKLPKATEEQSAIGQTLADMDAELEALEMRLEKARQINQGMIQELLMGRVRLV